MLHDYRGSSQATKRLDNILQPLKVTNIGWDCKQAMMSIVQSLLWAIIQVTELAINKK